MARTPQHTYRVTADLYARAQRRAGQRGETIADVIRRALIDYTSPTPTPANHPGRRWSDQRQQQQQQQQRRTA